jgi:hypothetical protein
MTLPLSVANTTSIENVEPWMLCIAMRRPGMYKIRVTTTRTDRATACYRRVGYDLPHEIEVNITGAEFAKLDKVIMNQSYAESKPKVQAAIVFQHAAVIWPTHTPDDVTMRTLGAWAITQYRCNGDWLGRICDCVPCLGRRRPARLELIRGNQQGGANILAPAAPAQGAPPAPGGPSDSSNCPPGDGVGPPPPDASVLIAVVTPDGQVVPAQQPWVTHPRVAAESFVDPPRNELGFVEPGHGNEDLHPLGGTTDEDSEIRANREDRILENSAGIGVVGQSTEPSNRKQVVGVVSLPVTDPPNVYAREVASIESAIDNRITKKQRPFTANKDDKALIGRMVFDAIGNNPRRSLFSAKRVTEWWGKCVFEELRSGKWTEDRLNKTVESLCCRIQPAFKLKCDVKLESMPEGKAPRMLIADGDEGQVLSLITICCIEDLIKKHLPKKGIKGKGKRDAMERIAAELRVPKVAYSRTGQLQGKAKGKGKKPLLGEKDENGMSVFEGDGSAWDTTCSIQLRDCVENPVILHVASILKVLMSEPEAWAQAHSDISVMRDLTLNFKKNKEFRTYIIDAIRRSGHRGTSCLNWWTNFVCWHCAIFEMPETYLDPEVKYGKDHTGANRWLASAFEGDDSILSTTPRIKEKDELYVSLMQRWERFGFNMKIFIRSDRALFTGYYHALDADGPTGVFMPEVDRCFARAGISCSPTMIEYFKKEDRAGCLSIARAAALARAHEFAGLSPTISVKYLRFYESLGVKTLVDRDLQMRTCGGDAVFSEPEIVAEINVKNGAAMSFDQAECARLAAVGFPCTEEELSQFSLRIWDYDLLKDWDGFRASLPVSWRSASANA